MAKAMTTNASQPATALRRCRALQPPAMAARFGGLRDIARAPTLAAHSTAAIRSCEHGRGGFPAPRRSLRVGQAPDSEPLVLVPRLVGYLPPQPRGRGERRGGGL